MRVLMNVRRIELGERSERDPFITCDTFSIDIADSVHTKLNNIDWFIVGDAAANLAYPVRLKSGFASARLLSRSPEQYNQNARVLFKEMEARSQWEDIPNRPSSSCNVWNYISKQNKQ